MREIIVDNFAIIKPALFSTPMVQAILADRKSKTRRVVKGLALKWLTEDGFSPVFVADPGNKLSPYAVGDILWVRETWCNISKPEYPPEYYYLADADYCEDYDAREWKWRPSIFMPREAARLFLRVMDVRVERVQDITEADAKAEGVASFWAAPHRDDPPFIGAAKGAAKQVGDDLCYTRRKAFRQLWDNLNARRGHGWDTNPWVWVYTFERAEKPEGWEG